MATKKAAAAAKVAATVSPDPETQEDGGQTAPLDIDIAEPAPVAKAPAAVKAKPATRPLTLDQMQVIAALNAGVES